MPASTVLPVMLAANTPPIVMKPTASAMPAMTVSSVACSWARPAIATPRR